MSLPLKEVTCDCGNVLETDRKRDWCTTCGRPVFYHLKDKRLNKLNSLYLTAMILGAFVFMGYIFLQVVAVPLLTMQ